MAYTTTHPRQSACWKFWTCVALVILADFLFYHVGGIGGIAGLFSSLLLAAVLFYNPRRIQSMPGKVLAISIFGLTLGMVEMPNALNFSLYVFCLLALVGDRHTLMTKQVLRWINMIGTYAACGWIRLLLDGHQWLKLQKRSRKRQMRTRWIYTYLLPLCLTGVFILLFTQANPVIGRWLEIVSWQTLLQFFSLPRLLFWLVMAAGCWAVVRPRLKYRVYAPPISGHSNPYLDAFFNPRSITLSLLLFNALFLVQNLLDIAFLWSGGALPAGLTQAAYAHRGAYPLILTALLAAVFVVIALRPGSGTQNHGFIRGLIYGWVGQNIFLVASSISRLLGYIEEYSLTYLRIAALIWMGLVACGLVLIVVRMYFQRTTAWLIHANLATLFMTLYVASFVSFGSIIASYNVRHSREVTGAGNYLDIDYLTQMGPAALPGLRWFSQHATYSPSAAMNARNAAQQLEQTMRSDNANWRAWTWQSYRLKEGLSTVTAPSYAPNDPGTSWQMEQQ